MFLDSYITLPKEVFSLVLTSSGTDQEDEALNRWKQSLGLASGNTVADPNDPRKCVIKSLALVQRLSFCSRPRSY